MDQHLKSQYCLNRTICRATRTQQQQSSSRALTDWTGAWRHHCKQHVNPVLAHLEVVHLAIHPPSQALAVDKLAPLVQRWAAGCNLSCQAVQGPEDLHPRDCLNSDIPVRPWRYHSAASAAVESKAPEQQAAMSTSPFTLLPPRLSGLMLHAGHAQGGALIVNAGRDPSMAIPRMSFATRKAISSTPSCFLSQGSPSPPVVYRRYTIPSPCLLIMRKKTPWVGAQQALFQQVQSCTRQVPAPTSMVRLLMKCACGWVVRAGARSSRSDLTPSLPSRVLRVRPVGPPPTITTGHRSVAAEKGSCGGSVCGRERAVPVSAAHCKTGIDRHHDGQCAGQRRAFSPSRAASALAGAGTGRESEAGSADCSRGAPLLASDAVAKHCRWPASLCPCCGSCVEYSHSQPEPLMLAGSLEVQVLQKVLQLILLVCKPAKRKRGHCTDSRQSPPDAWQSAERQTAEAQVGWLS